MTEGCDRRAEVTAMLERIDEAVKNVERRYPLKQRLGETGNEYLRRCLGAHWYRDTLAVMVLTYLVVYFGLTEIGVSSSLCIFLSFLVGVYVTYRFVRRRVGMRARTMAMAQFVSEDDDDVAHHD